jgi:hypothetical protein
MPGIVLTISTIALTKEKKIGVLQLFFISALAPKDGT